MKILGIDPGTTRAGYGVIESKSGQLRLLKSGVLKVLAKDKNRRLLELANEFEKLIKKEKPDLVALEKLFFVKNIKTGMDVSEARGVFKIIVLKNKIDFVELAPSEIKLNIAGYGSADKKAVAKMAARIIGIDKIEGPDDVSDAVAIALVASFQNKVFKKLRGDY